MVDTTGVIDYGSLMYLALQRARNAREAIKVMTSLAEKYGYNSEGETFTICDPNEAWIMEMMGWEATSIRRWCGVPCAYPTTLFADTPTRAALGW